jgi:hypothetical protein
MKLFVFGLFRKKKQSMTPEAAAARLASRVMIGPEKKLFSGLDEEHLHSISDLIHLTNIAIVIHWLRLLEQGLSDPEKSRARAILKEFQLVTGSGASEEEAPEQVTELQRLTNQMTKLQQISNDKKILKAEYSSKTLVWSKEWLAPVFDNEDCLERASQTYGPALVAHVNGSIKMLLKSVEAAVFQKNIA